MKYPIGIQSFDQIINEGFVYIDKTDMIYSLANEGKIYFLSRLFSGLKIDRLEKEWNVHPVFHIDFNGSDFTRQGALYAMIDDYIANWEAQYGITGVNKEIGLGVRFRHVLAKAHGQTGQRAVVLIDEYDKPILDVLDINSDLEEEHRNGTYQGNGKNIRTFAGGNEGNAERTIRRISLQQKHDRHL